MIQLSQIVTYIALAAAEICFGLELPSEIHEEQLDAMVAQIPETEKGRLFNVEFLSYKKKVDVRQLLQDPTYGVRLSFAVEPCGIASIYVFVLEAEVWKLESQVTRAEPPFCTNPKDVCDRKE